MVQFREAEHIFLCQQFCNGFLCRNFKEEFYLFLGSQLKHKKNASKASAESVVNLVANLIQRKIIIRICSSSAMRLGLASNNKLAILKGCMALRGLGYNIGQQKLTSFCIMLDISSICFSKILS